MIDISPFTALVGADHGLAVVAIALPDGSVHSSVGNVGILPHPLTGAPVVGLVIVGRARKLPLLRAHPRATVTLRAGWQWAAIDGPVELVGPDDPQAGISADRLRLLLREKSSPPLAARTTIGPPTTGSWPRSDVLPS